MQWSADGWAIIGVILAGLTAVYWHFDRFEKRLNNGADKYARDRAARALTAPGPWKAYLFALRGALDGLTHWMGQRAGLKIWTSERGDWAKSFGWCLSLAFLYPPAILFIFWLFGGSATIGTAELLPPPGELPFWRRLLLVMILVMTTAAAFSIMRNERTSTPGPQHGLNAISGNACQPGNVPSQKLRFQLPSA